MQVPPPNGRYAYSGVHRDARICFYRQTTDVPVHPPIGSRDFAFCASTTRRYRALWKPAPWGQWGGVKLVRRLGLAVTYLLDGSLDGWPVRCRSRRRYRPLLLVACGPTGGNARRPVVADVNAAAPSSAPVKKAAAPPHAALPRSVTAHPAGPQQVVFHGPRNVPRVALTFDSNMTTFMLQELRARTVRCFVNTRVMDELDAMHVPATFFLSGLWMQQYPAETRRLATDPLLELGSHSYSHRAFHGPCYGLGTLAPGTMAADVRSPTEATGRPARHASRSSRRGRPGPGNARRGGRRRT